MCGFDGKPIFRDGEELLSDLIKRELGIRIDKAALRIFIRSQWDKVAALAHRIHQEK